MSKITKLGYGVIVFDDVCHLRNMLTEVRTYCDEIVVCLQNESYYGNPIDQNVVKHIGQLVEEKLVDDVIWFKPENLHEEEGNHSPRFVETDKRNYILDFLEKNGCSHAMVIDSDEFYELVIRKIVEETPWRDNSTKVILLISDAAPHPLGYTYQDYVVRNQIDWRIEARNASQKGIK